MREIAVKLSQFLGIYPLMMKIDNRVQMRRQNRAFKKYGLEALQKAVEASEEAGGHLFLAFGSLLGAYREKGFIPYDFDLDTGLMASERTPLLMQTFKDKGFGFLRQYYVKSSGRISEDKLEYKGVHIDVHYFYPDGDGNLFCDLCLPHESKPWREANASDGFPAIVRTVPESGLAKQDFLGVGVYMPERTEQWLKSLYGEHFMTPDPHWSMSDHKKRSQTRGERLYRRELTF